MSGRNTMSNHKITNKFKKGKCNENEKKKREKKTKRNLQKKNEKDRK